MSALLCQDPFFDRDCKWHRFATGRFQLGQCKGLARLAARVHPGFHGRLRTNAHNAPDAMIALAMLSCSGRHVSASILLCITHGKFSRPSNGQGAFSTTLLFR